MSGFSSVTKGECLCLQRSGGALGQVRTRLACLLPSNRHCYYSMQRPTHMKQRRTECPLNVLQAYNRQSKTTSTITSNLFRNFRRHFLKINFRYNVRFLTSTATFTIDCRRLGACRNSLWLKVPQSKYDTWRQKRGKNQSRGGSNLAYV